MSENKQKKVLKELMHKHNLKTVAELEKEDPHLWNNDSDVDDWILLPFMYLPTTGCPLVQKSNFDTILRELEGYVRTYSILGFPCPRQIPILSPDSPVDLLQKLGEILDDLKEYPIIDDADYQEQEIEILDRAVDDFIQANELTGLSEEEKQTIREFIGENGFEEEGDWFVKDENLEELKKQIKRGET